MSINLLFTNPNEKLTPMPIGTWNVLADGGGGSVTLNEGANIQITENAPSDYTIATTLPVPSVNDNGKVLGVSSGDYTLVTPTSSGNIIEGTNITITPSGNDFIVSTVNDPTFTGNLDVIADINCTGTVACEGFVLGTLGLPIPDTNNTFLEYNGTNMVWSAISEAGAITAGTNIQVTPSGNDFEISTVNNPTFTGNLDVTANINCTGTVACESFVLGTLGLPIPDTADTILSYNGTVMSWVQNSADGVQSVTGTNFEVEVNNADPTNPIISLPDTIHVGTIWANAIQLNSIPDNLNPVVLPILNDGSYPPNGYVLASDGNGGSNFIENTADGVQSVSGASNQIAVNDTDPLNPIIFLPNIINAPGSFSAKQITLDDVNGDSVFTFPLSQTQPAENTLIVTNASGGSDFKQLAEVFFTTDQNVNPSDIIASTNSLEGKCVLTLNASGRGINKILATDNVDGSTLLWVDNAVDGVQSVTGTNFEVEVNNSDPTNPIISLPDTIHVGTIWTNAIQLNSIPDNLNPVVLPILNDGSYPPNGYVLASDGNGGSNFIENTADGVQNVYGSSNINITGTSSDPVINLEDMISLQEVQAVTIEIKSLPSNTHPVSLPQLSDGSYPNSGYVLASNGDGTTSFIENTADGVQSVSGTTNQIVIAGTITDPVVELATEVILGNITINSANDKIETNDNPTNAGVVSGDHVKTSTIITNDIFVTSKLTTGGTYPSYKLPEITDDQDIGTNLLMVTGLADMNNNNALQFTSIGNLIAPDQDIENTPTPAGIAQLNINASGRAPDYVLAVNPTNTGLNWIPMGSGMDSQTVYQLINNTQVPPNPTVFNMAIVCTLWTTGLKTIQFHFAQNYTSNANYAPILMGVDPAIGFYPQFADTPGTFPSCLTYLSGDNVSFTDFPSTYGVQSAGSIDISGSSIVLDPSVQIGVSPIYRLNSTPSQLGYCQVVLTPFGIQFNFLENTTQFPSLNVPANDKIGFGYLDGEPATFSCTYF